MVWPSMSIVTVRRGRRVWMSFLKADAGRGLQVAGDGQGGEHEGQVGLDRVAVVVEHRPCPQVVLGHPEGAFDLVEVVVGVDHALAVHRRDGQVRDVALQPGSTGEGGGVGGS